MSGQIHDNDSKYSSSENLWKTRYEVDKKACSFHTLVRTLTHFIKHHFQCPYITQIGLHYFTDYTADTFSRLVSTVCGGGSLCDGCPPCPSSWPILLYPSLWPSQISISHIRFLGPSWLLISCTAQQKAPSAVDK